jgi:hypothetical protein
MALLAVSIKDVAVGGFKIKFTPAPADPATVTVDINGATGLTLGAVVDGYYPVAIPGANELTPGIAYALTINSAGDVDTFDPAAPELVVALTVTNSLATRTETLGGTGTGQFSTTELSGEAFAMDSEQFTAGEKPATANSGIAILKPDIVHFNGDDVDFKIVLRDSTGAVVTDGKYELEFNLSVS